MADDTLDPITQLHGADPAQGAPEPDLDAIRARAAQQSTVVPMRRRRTAVTVGAVAAGVAMVSAPATSRLPSSSAERKIP